MINFPCLCGAKFSLPDQLAGTSFQCKACGLLVSVPTLDDLKLLRPDGTYDVDMRVPQHATRSAQPMLPTDSSITPAQALEAIPLDDFEMEAKPTPRYDPFTGELIRAVEVGAVVHTEASKAMPRVQPLDKSNNRAAVNAAPKNSWLLVLGEMFMTKNITVLFVMWCIHAFIAFVFFLAAGTAVGVALYLFPVIFLFPALGYYSLVIQETGPGERDEIPTPMRNFEFKFDIWDPFVHCVISLAICFAPALFLLSELGNSQTGTIVFAIAAIIGAFFLPAIFLTAAVDGVLANFRPDRVIGVIFAAGADYLPIFIGWSIGGVLLIDGEIGIYGKTISLFLRPGETVEKPAYVLGGGPSMIMVAVGLYLSYYACWLLGHVWRKHHAEFPWVAQVFMRPKPPLPPHIRHSKV